MSTIKLMTQMMQTLLQYPKRRKEDGHLKQKNQRCSSPCKDQKQYLIEKFNLGKVTGYKEDPAQVSRDMHYALQGGKKRFNKEHYLTAGQVASFFSRLAMTDRKGENQDAEDFRAASADRKLFSLREKVLSQI
ncbi:uncharacterized protein LOC144619903 [Crassostrea virginica]